MHYLNNTDNASFHPTSSASSELDEYPFFGQISSTKDFDVQAYNAFASCWGMTEIPSVPIGLSTSDQETTGHVARDTSYLTQAGGYGQSSSSGHYWPAVDYQGQPDHSGIGRQGDSFATTVASESLAAIPTPSSVPLDCWGGIQSGPSTSTFDTQNVQPYQPRTGPTRTGLTQTGRFQPYGMSRTRTNEHRNAEAGPSTLVPSSIPHVGTLTPQPSGGISETTADAENQQTCTEEDKVPKSQKTKRPRGQGPPRPYRIQMDGDTKRLCKWVQRRKGLSNPPSLNKALAVAVEIIPTIRPLANQWPRLLTNRSERTAQGSKSPDEEFGRRNEERRLFKELSRYYPLRQDQTSWTRPPLLSHVVQDLEDLPALPGPSDEPPP